MPFIFEIVKYIDRAVFCVYNPPGADLREVPCKSAAVAATVMPLALEKKYNCI